MLCSCLQVTRCLRMAASGSRPCPPDRVERGRQPGDVTAAGPILFLILLPSCNLAPVFVTSMPRLQTREPESRRRRSG